MNCWISSITYSQWTKASWTNKVCSRNTPTKPYCRHTWVELTHWTSLQSGIKSFPWAYQVALLYYILFFFAITVIYIVLYPFILEIFFLTVKDVCVKQYAQCIARSTQSLRAIKQVNKVYNYIQLLPWVLTVLHKFISELASLVPMQAPQLQVKKERG